MTIEAWVPILGSNKPKTILSFSLIYDHPLQILFISQQLKTTKIFGCFALKMKVHHKSNIPIAISAITLSEFYKYIQYNQCNFQSICDFALFIDDN